MFCARFCKCFVHYLNKVTVAYIHRNSVVGLATAVISASPTSASNKGSHCTCICTYVSHFLFACGSCGRLTDKGRDVAYHQIKSNYDYRILIVSYLPIFIGLTFYPWSIGQRGLCVAETFLVHVFQKPYPLVLYKT